MAWEGSYFVPDVSRPLSQFAEGLDTLASDRRSREIGTLASEGRLSDAATASMKSGDLKTGLALRGAAQDEQDKIASTLGKYAQAADTPEKWNKFIGVAKQRFPGANLDQFADFAARDAVLAEVTDPDQKWKRELETRKEIREQEAHNLKMREGTAPKLETVFDDKGRETRATWDPQARRFVPVGGAKAPKNTAGISTTEKKMIVEADDAVLSGNNVIESLNKALDLNKRAYSGGAADARSYIASTLPDILVPGEKSRAVDTQELKTLVTSQALDQLKSTFGSMPTEGERKILLEIQGSVDQAPEVRERIFKRAIEMAKRRVDLAKRQADGIRSGTYFTEGGSDDLVTERPSPAPKPSSFREGQRIRNPNTGEMRVFKNGQWVPE